MWACDIKTRSGFGDTRSRKRRSHQPFDTQRNRSQMDTGAFAENRVSEDRKSIHFHQYAAMSEPSSMNPVSGHLAGSGRSCGGSIGRFNSRVYCFQKPGAA